MSGSTARCRSVAVRSSCCRGPVLPNIVLETLARRPLLADVLFQDVDGTGTNLRYHDEGCQAEVQTRWYPARDLSGKEDVPLHCSRYSPRLFYPNPGLYRLSGFDCLRRSTGSPVLQRATGPLHLATVCFRPFGRKAHNGLTATPDTCHRRRLSHGHESAAHW